MHNYYYMLCLTEFCNYLIINSYSANVKYRELLIMPADGRWNLTWAFKGLKHDGMVIFKERER
jgi:hypothetical protein